MAVRNGTLISKLAAKGDAAIKDAASYNQQADDLTSQIAGLRQAAGSASRQAEGISKAIAVLDEYGVTGI